MMNDTSSTLPTIEFYSDIHCPWAYMALYRLRKVWPEYAGRLRIVFRALSLELKNRRSTPKPILDKEIVLMQHQERDLPIHEWNAAEWRYVPTLLPAFEGEKSAAQQGDAAVWEFSWQIRRAFFARSRTICMRYVLEDVAREAGLDVDLFLQDWDSGLMREVVIAESLHGWNELEVTGSPTFVLPSGKQVWNPGADRVTWGKTFEIVEVRPADCPNDDCLQIYRDMLDEAIEPVKSSLNN